ncbi:MULTISPECIES: hypothetical protein [Alicyclobacillus]|uniref:Uncharacterized protein n=1 Tax=Alicyclobacillus acidoterrestris (strain ATCC 49025 / DSM 3922 / CIP 106132 / NCIMB 13137 / GD3B) TaxID=1356854 RepID=T0D201_ALIAG|nr:MULTISPECIES: hypothetical protein [Alicyclobacillus]EPZ43791.1 hypothetical protein N007_12115 [Alicyclobacillus acidoterrestris ATCC 49025]UNO50986.1 hypothetical protein K1I37_21190 [Alicyclobacillus acidoterrestris]GEO27559.1 hypothetical protein AAC03nite_33440 [Alicyclobacillus acidoterrestris]
MTGLELYREIDRWYEETRTNLNQLLKHDSQPFQSPEDIKAPLRIMVFAMECEGMLVQLNRAVGDLWWSSIEDIELKLRGIRDTIGRLVADSIVQGLLEQKYSPEDYGIQVERQKSGFTLKIPYELISMSDLFLVRSKRINGLSHLYTVREAWIALMRGISLKLKEHGHYPLLRARVKVCIEITHSIPLDPDHFWIRPLIDGLCQSGILMNDDAKRLVFILSYKSAMSSNSVVIDVEELDDIAANKPCE